MTDQEYHRIISERNSKLPDQTLIERLESEIDRLRAANAELVEAFQEIETELIERVTMETQDARPMQIYGTPGPGKGPVLFRAMTACDCGCGRKARFEFRVGRDTIEIDDPAMIKALIVEMQVGYALLWGPENDRSA